MNTMPVVSCVLVAAVCVAIGGYITAAVVLCIVAALIEFFMPGLTNVRAKPPQTR